MAKRNTKSRSKKWLIPIIIVLLLGILGGIIDLVHTHNTKDEKATLTSVATSSSPADNNFNNSRKESSSPATTLDNGPVASTPTTSPGSTSSISLTVTRASIEDNELQVGTLVSGTTSGTCMLSVSQSGQNTITSSDQVTLQNNSYVCPVFSIPTDSFPNQGNWNVSVSLTSGSNSATGTWASNPVDLSGNP